VVPRYDYGAIDGASDRTSYTPTPSNTGAASWLKVMTTVKDGQLGWAVIAMGSSAIYELWGILAAGKPVPGWEGWAFGGLILVMLSAMLVAAGGAVFSIPLLTTAAGGAKAWVAHYKLFVGSAVMAAVAAFLYTCIHFSTSPCSR
jgi:hypothetical protein